MRRVEALVVGCFVLLASGTTSWACSCVRRPSCGPGRYSDADFVGEIISREILPSDGKISTLLSNVFEARVFKVRVIEGFRGGPNKGAVVSVKAGLGGGDCGYEFKIGAEYLIDAARQGSVFLTGICFLTSPVAQSGAEIRALRIIAANQRLPDLTGLVIYEPETDGSEGGTPMVGVTVEIVRATGGVPLRTVTDTVGSFTFASLPQDRYRLALSLPSNLSVTHTSTGGEIADQVPVFIEHKNPETVACRISLFVGPGGSIGGIVKSADGRAVDGWVNADTVTPEGKPWNTVLSVQPMPGGVFRLAPLKAGRYHIQFTSRAGFVQGYPQIVDLRDGERKTGLVLLAR